MMKRLRKANLVLMEVEQLDEENIEARNAMNYIKYDLINPLIVKSSNKDVKLLAGCCLIHILRILAPMSN